MSYELRVASCDRVYFIRDFCFINKPFLIGDRLALKLLFALLDFITDFLAVYMV